MKNIFFIISLFLAFSINAKSFGISYEYSKSRGSAPAFTVQTQKKTNNEYAVSVNTNASNSCLWESNDVDLLSQNRDFQKITIRLKSKNKTALLNLNIVSSGGIRQVKEIKLKPFASSNNTSNKSNTSSNNTSNKSNTSSNNTSNKSNKKKEESKKNTTETKDTKKTGENNGKSTETKKTKDPIPNAGSTTSNRKPDGNKSQNNSKGEKKFSYKVSVNRQKHNNEVGDILKFQVSILLNDNNNIKELDITKDTVFGFLPYNAVKMIDKGNFVFLKPGFISARLKHNNFLESYNFYVKEKKEDSVNQKPKTTNTPDKKLKKRSVKKEINPKTTKVDTVGGCNLHVTKAYEVKKAAIDWLAIILIFLFAYFVLTRNN